MGVKAGWRRLVLGAGVIGLLAMPLAARADGFNMRVKVGADDQAHFNFKAGARHYHPMIWKAAVQLRRAKHILWVAADDFHGHKVQAIEAINGALDQLRICAQQ